MRSQGLQLLMNRENPALALQNRRSLWWDLGLPGIQSLLTRNQDLGALLGWGL
jgi:hypothetical protein